MHNADESKKWDVYYDASPENLDWGQTEPQSVLGRIFMQVLASLKLGEAHVLDIGCGNGRNSRLLDFISGMKIRYQGIDFSASAIAYCRRKFGWDKNRVFQRADVTEPLSVSWTESFDLAFDFGCFHAIAPAKRERYVKNVATVIRPGGMLLLGGWFSSKMDSKQVYFKGGNGNLDEWAISEDTIRKEFCGAFDAVSFVLDTKEIKLNEGFLYALLKRKTGPRGLVVWAWSANPWVARHE
jgi:SAM-dependent methyltransferase